MTVVNFNRVVNCIMSEQGESRIISLARYFNNFYLKLLIPEEQKTYPKLKLCKETIGLVRPASLPHLKKYPDVFEISVEENGVVVVGISQELKGYKERSKAFARVLQEFRQSDTFVTLRGWRNECFEVKSGGGWSGGNNGQPLLEMERSATCIFGIRQFGVDINGYVRHPEKGLCIWLQKRAEDKQTWPGKMDNMVGGGLAVGYSVLETALKEASEEAGIPSDLLISSKKELLRPAGSVSFYFESERGLFPNTEFVFDLELPLDFEPQNQDGEVQGFLLLPAQEVLEIVLSPAFKTTSCPVTLDFLVRHGVINQQNEPHLEELKRLLHVPLNQIYKN